MTQMTVQQAITAGIQHHQAGRLREAEAIYRQVLAAQPNNPDALHLLGGVAMQSQNFPVAIDLIRRAIAIRPDVADFYSNLGVALRLAGRSGEAVPVYEKELSLRKQPNVVLLNNLGDALESAGRHEEAAARFRQATVLDPNSADSFNNLGIALRRRNDLSGSLAAFQRAVQINPSYAGALSNVGEILRSMGRYDEAIAYLKRAVAITPGLADGHFNLAVTYQNSSRFAEAIASYRTALSLNPNLFAACNNLGVLLRHQGKAQEAISLFRKALSIAPKFADASSNLGIALNEIGQTDQAIEAFKAAVNSQPDFPEAWNNLGNVVRDRLQFDEARRCYEKAIALNPRYADAHNNLGIALQEMNLLDEALAAFRRAIELQPDNAEAHNNLGGALLKKHQVADAIPFLERALQLKPKLAKAHNNLASAYHRQVRLEDAAASFRRAIELEPQWKLPRFNLGLLLLFQGDFEQGWIEHEARCDAPELRHIKQNLPRPRWDGSDLNGKRILIYTEQGFGDAIQFARYVPMVAERGGRVILGCRAPLVSLFRTVEGVEQLISQDESLPEFDCHCSLMSLPALFKTTLDTIPKNIPYLKADPQKIQRWRDRFAEADDRLKVGLVWAGNPAQENDVNRSMRLENYAALASVEGVRFYAMQKAAGAEQAKHPPAGMDFTDLSDEIADFSDSAAVLSNLDLLISVDTAPAHLAGALGRPVWTILTYHPDWRWMKDRLDCPWYPTMRLFRQQQQGIWDVPVQQAAEQLRQLARRA